MAETSLTVSNENGGSLSVRINDVFDLILKSPQVTQLFARAVAKVVTSMVVGAVSEVIVTIDQGAKQVECQLYENKVKLHIAKMEYATKAYADAVIKAEADPNLPVAFKQELQDRLYHAFYKELSDLVPGCS